ncbi:MAG TPA: hypothetical protein VEI53_07440, partial [Ktedonobacteraceae bacterium]|nr:hypothetical protein [Ktedonobacteraceae bacterium]
DLDPLDLPYKRYTFVDTAGYSSWTTDTHVLLDGQRIATWVSTYNQHTYPAYYRKRLQVEQNAEQTIFDALGMPKEAYSRYIAREAQRRAVMNMIEGEDIPEPALEVVFADQD